MAEIPEGAKWPKKEKLERAQKTIQNDCWYMQKQIIGVYRHFSLIKDRYLLMVLCIIQRVHPMQHAVYQMKSIRKTRFVQFLQKSEFYHPPGNCMSNHLESNSAPLIIKPHDLMCLYVHSTNGAGRVTCWLFKAFVQIASVTKQHH